jgi:hypothetical protein
MIKESKKVYWCISGIIILDGIALLMGQDGWLLGTAIALLGGIAGYNVKELLK